MGRNLLLLGRLYLLINLIYFIFTAMIQQKNIYNVIIIVIIIIIIVIITLIKV